MSQLRKFPYLLSFEPQVGVAALIEACKAIAEATLTAPDLRVLLMEHKLWNEDRINHLLAFLGMGIEGNLEASPFVESLREPPLGEARELVAQRLWDVNPVLFKSIVEYLAERVAPERDLISFLESPGYRGRTVLGADVRDWLHLARGVGVVRTVGIAYGIDERGESYLDKARALDVELFLAKYSPSDDNDNVVVEWDAEDAPQSDDGDEESTSEQAIAPAAPSAPKSPLSPVSLDHLQHLESPQRPDVVSIGHFVGQAVFPDDVLDETSQRLQQWWESQKPGRGLGLEAFGLSAETWMENSEEALYRLAVAAALVFRLGTPSDRVITSFVTLDKAGVLSDLYYGTAPNELPGGLDPKALMLASLVARRCAEVPDLAASLERLDSAAAAFDTLDSALGRGLFEMELFWIMRGLADLGAIRFDDLDGYTALPHRLVRDTLFRLGFVATPYAHDAASLKAAAVAAGRAAGVARPADEVLAGFALACGCSFYCGNRARCSFACRERGSIA